MTSDAGGGPRVDEPQPAASGGQVLRPVRWQRHQRALVDRSTERARIDELVDVVRRGLSAVLVLRGCQGAGKTTLLDYAAEAASGFRVASVAGVESEINLPYGAVHQLLIPFLPLIDDLPVPQRQALQVAFGMKAGSRLVTSAARSPGIVLSAGSSVVAHSVELQ